MKIKQQSYSQSNIENQIYLKGPPRTHAHQLVQKYKNNTERGTQAFLSIPPPLKIHHEDEGQDEG